MSVDVATIEISRHAEDSMENRGTDNSPRLRERRLQRGLIQLEVAEGIERLAWAQSSRRVGVNADMVSKWERGKKAPSRFYLRLLCSFFNATADQLGYGLGQTAPVGAGSFGSRAALNEAYSAL